MSRTQDAERSTGTGHRWLLPATVIAVVGLVAAAILRVPPEAALYERVAVAVFPFEQPGEVRHHLPTDLSKSIEAQLRGAPGIVTVSGGRRDRVSAGGWLELASALEAEFALIGTIRPDSAMDGAARWLVIPHLIRVADAGRQWSGRYSVGSDPGDLVDLQTQIVAEVAKAIRSAS